MKDKMTKKFDKYWGSCNIMISIAAALDPRNKMKYIEHCASNFFSEADGVLFKVTVRETLNNLYAEYVEEYRAGSSIGRSCSSENDVIASERGSASVLIGSNPSNYAGYLQTVDDVEDLKSDLDTYFEEKVIKWKEPGHFDVIMWWKLNSQKFIILSKMACDVLSIPITTVASKSAFSACGRVIEPHRASLAVDTVQMLLCAGDWLRATYGIKGKKKDDIQDIKEYTMS
ncbi:zinc finger BED domain-containing protein RICESLEEPER 2-like [Salvia miltiorrhiza]|uniref:zinc finger BED domain-containing protein RICESLEEPER 2-like n=1 Tax=Salvia miltiorrhiza TaxID=226208 RepID=UPI0025ACADF1|nr:zinc finger BED domain-containing protein RICESLEEPER 2-like [Salvia miltiorrhiza]